MHTVSNNLEGGPPLFFQIIQRSIIDIGFDISFLILFTFSSLNHFLKSCRHLSN